MITQSELKKRLNYNPETGVFTRMVSAGNVKSGAIAGWLNKGYLRIRVKDRAYYAHRLAFLYMTGEIPEEVDHINHVKDDNRWENLRPATRSTNTKNKSMQSNNTSGHIGVNWNKAKQKWHVRIGVGERIHLGFFADINNAIQVRKEANTKYDFHQNHGK